MLFPVKAIQVDGGSEFEAIFEENARGEASNCLFYRHAHPSSMVALSELTGLIPRNSTK